MSSRLILLAGTIGLLAACSDFTGLDAKTDPIDPPEVRPSPAAPPTLGNPAPKK